MGVANSFDQYPRDWYQWYTSSEPENNPLPGEWENSCNELQRMLIVRSLHPDRISRHSSSTTLEQSSPSPCTQHGCCS